MPIFSRLTAAVQARRPIIGAPMRRILLVLAAAVFVPGAGAFQPPDPPPHPDDRRDLADRYRETAGRTLGASLTDVDGRKKLEHLALRIGHRLSGSVGLERAIQWAADTRGGRNWTGFTGRRSWSRTGYAVGPGQGCLHLRKMNFPSSPSGAASALPRKASPLGRSWPESTPTP